MKKQKGFTLIELLVVIAIIAVLSAIGLTSYGVANKKARDSRRAADVQQVRSALEMYRSASATGIYPTSGTWALLMTSLTTYLSGQNIEDPKNSGSYTYTYSTNAGADYEIGYCKEVLKTGETCPLKYTNP